MGTLKHRMKHAFAVDPPGPAEPTAEQQPAVDWLCGQVARRRLATPGLIALEMCRPLNYMGAQAMHFFEPALAAFLRKATTDHYQHLARFLEQRGSIEYLCRRIEEMEAEKDQAVRRAAAPEGPEKDS